VDLTQAVLDRMRVMNKHVTNKLMIHIAGKRFGHFAILTHEGRKTGKRYRIPIIAEPAGEGFVIALTYGKKVDWAANVLAKGACSLVWKNKDYALAQPRFVDRETGLKAFPPLLAAVLRRIGIRDFMELSVRS
jgi:deazaflavin-dependent oxidoreductase (nitroreductase family)